MLAIRMQRSGRRGHAQFRVVVQDSRYNPKSGRVVAYLGVYDPHSKSVTLDGEKTSKYLSNGARPSDRVARILQVEGIKLPGWVKTAEPKERSTRHPEKRRSTAPAETAKPDEEAADVDETEGGTTAETEALAEETQAPETAEKKEAKEA